MTTFIHKRQIPLIAGKQINNNKRNQKQFVKSETIREIKKTIREIKKNNS